MAQGSSLNTGAAALSPEHLYSIVDIGSNGIRCSISDLSPPWAQYIPAVYESKIDISLLDVLKPPGMASSEKQKIPKSVIATLVKGLEKFKKKVDGYSVPSSQSYVVATEGLRSAPNSDEVQDAITSATGWKVRLLSSKEESLMGVYGVRSVVSDLRGGLVMDIGGGSIQLSWITPSLDENKDEPIDTRIENCLSVGIPRGAAAVTSELTTALKMDKDDPDGWYSDEVRKKVSLDVRRALAEVVGFESVGLWRGQDVEEQDPSKSPPAEIRVYLTGGGLRGWGKVLRKRFQDERGYYLDGINGFEFLGNMLVRSKYTAMMYYNDDKNTQVSAAGVSMITPYRGKCLTTSSYASLDNLLTLAEVTQPVPHPGSRMSGPVTGRMLSDARLVTEAARTRVREGAKINARRLNQIPAITLAVDSVLAGLVDGYLRHHQPPGTVSIDDMCKTDVPVPRIVVRFCEGGVRQGVLFYQQLRTHTSGGLLDPTKGLSVFSDRPGILSALMFAKPRSVMELAKLFERPDEWTIESSTGDNTFTVKEISLPRLTADQDAELALELRAVLNSVAVLADKPIRPGAVAAVTVPLNSSASVFGLPFSAFMMPLQPDDPELDFDPELGKIAKMVTSVLSHRQRLLLAVILSERWGGMEGQNLGEKRSVWAMLWKRKNSWRTYEAGEGGDGGEGAGEGCFRREEPPGENSIVGEGQEAKPGAKADVVVDAELGDWLGPEGALDEELPQAAWAIAPGDGGDIDDGLTGLWPLEVAEIKTGVWLGRQLRKELDGRR